MIKPKKVVLFPEIGRVRIFYRPPARVSRVSGVYENMYFLFKKTHTQTFY